MRQPFDGDRLRGDLDDEDDAGVPRGDAENQRDQLQVVAQRAPWRARPRAPRSPPTSQPSRYCRQIATLRPARVTNGPLDVAKHVVQGANRPAWARSGASGAKHDESTRPTGRLQIVSARGRVKSRKLGVKLSRSPSQSCTCVVSRCILLALLSSLSTLAVAGQDVSKGRSAASVPELESTDRFIVKLRDPNADPSAALAAIGGTFGERLQHVRRMSGGAHVVRLGRRVMNLEARTVGSRLRADPRVVLFEPDVCCIRCWSRTTRGTATSGITTRPQGGINLPPAWDRTTGSSSITVAVIDTGVPPHVDLASRLVPGYDFVAHVAGGSDPGATTLQRPDQLLARHPRGRHHRRADQQRHRRRRRRLAPRSCRCACSGQCGGYTSDIADGMIWAGRHRRHWRPTNPSPARGQ